MQFSFDIVKDVLDSMKMIINWGAQELANRVDSMGNIRIRNSQVLQRTNKRVIRVGSEKVEALANKCWDTTMGV